jgi:tripartite-type tricarboxylate transporter receptor subunit TctC
LAFCVLMGAVQSAFAQTYPARTVRVVVAFPAGGSADIVGRVLAQKLGESTGQNFIIDNRPGAGGNIAFDLVARAEADGYTLLHSTPGIVINPSLYRKVNFKLEDFAPISLVGAAPLVVMVHPSLPVRSIAALVKLAKAKPGAVKFGSAGSGSTAHLASEMLRSQAGIELVHIPYKGGPPAFQDLIGGQVEMMTYPISESLPYIKSGRVIALAQTGARRSSVAPDLVTVAEAGLKGYDVTTWYVEFAPAKTPAAIIGKLHGELDKILRQPETQERLKSLGVDVIAASPEQTATFLKTEYARWAKAIQASGAKVD